VRSDDVIDYSRERAVARLATGLLEAWNSHDLERITAFYDLSYEGTDIGEARPQIGQADIRESMARYLRAFPDLRFVEEEVIIKRNRIVLFWTAKGKHMGPLLNIPPTGIEVSVRGVSMLTVLNGKIKRGIHIWDLAGLLRSIKLLPEL